MPILTINELFIHNGTNLDEFKIFRWSGSDGSDTGEQSTLLSASGQAISIDSPGAITIYKWTLRGITLPDLEWLRRFRAEFVLVRDGRGVREFGSYSVTSWTHWRNPRIVNIDIDFTAVGFDETR
jgi:hypothetical protein